MPTSLHQAKARLSELISKVERGAEVVIARRQMNSKSKPHHPVGPRSAGAMAAMERGPTESCYFKSLNP